MKLPRSKRFRFSVWVIVANFAIGMFGIWQGADLNALGVFLALSNAPLYAYVLGDTFRASNLNDINQ
jgi:threonine/homoserine efflux transporter RhtA